MTIRDIQQIGGEILRLLADYHNPPEKELLLDAILYAYLKGGRFKVARQHHVKVYNSKKPKRIDFRFGGTNPIVMELAVRSRSGGGSLTGSQNKRELFKLCRVSHTQARLRGLLLLDTAEDHHTKDDLKETYAFHAGRGKFQRRSVRVIYVHRQHTFTFPWSPYK